MSFDTLDFLTDASILDDPVPYYEHLLKCPVQHVPPHGVVAVTGYDEAVAVWRDPDAYSSVNSSSGPFPRLPSEPGTDDVTELIEEHRHEFPINEHITSFDPPKHAAHRALVAKHRCALSRSRVDRPKSHGRRMDIGRITVAPVIVTIPVAPH